MIFSNYNSAIGCNCLENDWKTQISYSFFRTCCLTTPHHSYAPWSGLRSRANNVSHSGCLAAGFHASFFDDLPCKCRSNKSVSKKSQQFSFQHMGGMISRSAAPEIHVKLWPVPGCQCAHQEWNLHESHPNPDLCCRSISAASWSLVFSNRRIVLSG